MTGCLKGEHQYVVALRRQGVVRWVDSPSTEQTLNTKEKEEKMGQTNTMKTNTKLGKDLRLATWNVRSLYRPGGLRITINELSKYKPLSQSFTSNGYNIYTSSLANNHEFGTDFLVDSKFNHTWLKTLHQSTSISALSE
jgi:hypothetical protein